MDFQATDPVAQPAAVLYKRGTINPNPNIQRSNITTPEFISELEDRIREMFEKDLKELKL